MSASTALLMIGLLSLGAVVLGVAIGLVIVGRQVRSLADSQRQVEGLAERLREVEGVVARLELRAPERTTALAVEHRGVAKGATAKRSRVDPAAPPMSGPTLIAIPNLPPPASGGTAAVELGRRFGAIWDLADSGASIDAIAKRSGQPIGQVELILALRRQLALKSGDRS
jgi:hypothetical protein